MLESYSDYKNFYFNLVKMVVYLVCYGVWLYGILGYMIVKAGEVL